MRQAKYSDGIVKIDGKNLQKVYIRMPTEYYVECPYCAHQFDCTENDEILECPSCKKKFWAEFCSGQI